MNQQRIWHYFQNEAPEVFQQAEGRLEFLARRVRRRAGKGAKVLNVGVGGGLFEEFATRLGLEVYSLDPDAEAVARLGERLGAEGRAVAGGLESIPFPDDTFDAVVVSEVLEHLSDETLALALVEIRRVLTRGGVVAGTVPSKENLSEQLTVCPHCGERFHRWGHQQSFDEARMREMLSKLFEVETVEERFLAPWSRLDWKGKAVSLVKRSLLRAGVSWPGVSLYFSAAKK